MATNKMYEVKRLLEDAQFCEVTAKKAFQKRTKQNMSLGNKLIGKAIRLEAQAENLYAEIVGDENRLGAKNLYDLFAITLWSGE